MTTVLGPAETTSLQLTSKKLLDICRDNALWKARCFEESSFLAQYYRRQHVLSRYTEQRATASASQDSSTQPPASRSPYELAEIRRKERIRIMENWDPSYPGENVNWYDEYIQRNAPVAVNWLQQPSWRDGSENTYIEARGLALYRPDATDHGTHELETIFAVSPLDDGSVCLWDVTGAKGRKGSIYAKSRPGILFMDGSSADNSSRSKRIDSGFTESVSVDSKSHLAFFAVQSRKLHLIASEWTSIMANREFHRPDRSGSPEARCCRLRIVPVVYHGAFTVGSLRSTHHRHKQWYSYV